MQDSLNAPAVLTRLDVSYLPLPNRVDLVLTDVPPPAELTPTAFMIGITDDGGLVLADHAERGPEISGGHLEPGETPEDAARREGCEETGATYWSVWPIGYLRCTSEGTVPEDHPYPHPVGYQALYAGSVVSMDARDDYLECRPPSIVHPAEFGSLDPSLAAQLVPMYDAAMRALGRDRTMEQLAAEARSIDDDDWGSERQVDAENRFFDECRRHRPATFDDAGDFADWCLKATTDERIDEAMRLLAA